MENAHDHLDTTFCIFCVSFLFPKLGVCLVFFFRVCMDDLVKTLKSVAGMHLSGRRTLNKSLWAAQTLKSVAGMHLSGRRTLNKSLWAAQTLKSVADMHRT